MAADRKRRISGPGASDFLSSPGGADRPGGSTGKGTASTRDDSAVTDARNLEPGLIPERDALPEERSAHVPANADPDTRPGSQTGRVGGGGADAHNAHPVRATGEDDSTAKD